MPLCLCVQATGGGAKKMCRDMDVPLLGRVPLDPGLGRAAEEGRSALTGATASVQALKGIVEAVVAAVAAGTK